MEKKKKLHFIRFYNSQNRETISVADSTHSNKQCRRPLKPLDVLSNAKKKKKKTKMQRKKSDLNYVSCLKVALKVPKHARCLLSFSCTFCASSSVFHFFMMCLFFSVFSLLFRLVCAIRTFFFFCIFYLFFAFVPFSVLVVHVVLFLSPWNLFRFICDGNKQRMPLPMPIHRCAWWEGAHCIV